MCAYIHLKKKFYNLENHCNFFRFFLNLFSWSVPFIKIEARILISCFKKILLIAPSSYKIFSMVLSNVVLMRAKLRELPNSYLSITTLSLKMKER